MTDEMFAEPKKWDVEHVELAQKADLLLVAPATAKNTIAKWQTASPTICSRACTFATEAPVLLAPAMNKNMYAHDATVQNPKTRRAAGNLSSRARGF